jgi:hypothetical protein
MEAARAAWRSFKAPAGRWFARYLGGSLSALEEDCFSLRMRMAVAMEEGEEMVAEATGVVATAAGIQEEIVETRAEMTAGPAVTLAPLEIKVILVWLRARHRHPMIPRLWQFLAIQAT